jgi:hypothetical protein
LKHNSRVEYYPLARESVMNNDLVQCDFCGEWYENESEGEGNE